MSIYKKEKISDEKMKKIELIMVIVLIIFAFGGYVITNYIFKSYKNNIAVWQDGIRIYEINGDKIDINKDMTFKIENNDGGYNVIEIKNKQVRCIDANCKDKICVNHGALSTNIDNDEIVCAPNKVVILYE